MRLLKYFAILFFLFTLLTNSYADGAETPTEKGKYTVSGYIKDETGETLIGATIFIKNLETGTVSNLYGYYAINLTPGEYELIYSYLGYEAKSKKLSLDKNHKINITLNPTTEEIEYVEITAKRKNENVARIEMSNVKLQMKAVKKLPAFLGEVDVIKSIQMLPGVQTAGEGTSGFYVRGGSVDQNLILLDGAPVFNPSHAGGIFSVFNGDAIKNVELFKGGISAEYGGRLSSVLDVRMKEGNTSNFKAYGGIGTISSRLTVEGPIVKDKGSFIVSGRRTYADMFLIFSKNEGLKNSKLYFYDLNAKANYKINDNNRIFLSGYFGRDVFNFDDFFQNDFGNTTTTLRWNHLFSPNFFTNVTFIGSNFDYGFGFPNGSTAFEWNAYIKNYGIKNDNTIFITPDNTIKFGIHTMYMDFSPGEAKKMDGSFFDIPGLPNSYALEHAAYIQNKLNINKNITIQYGVRSSLFQNIGKGVIYSFTKEDQYDGSYLMIPYDSTVYKDGEIIMTHPLTFEPRLGIRFFIDEQNSVKASYNRMFQYIHLASNTAAVTPFDLWFPSNPNIKPQKADQVAIGYFRNILDNAVELSLEGYYKKIYNAIDFRDHAELFLNKYFDGELRVGEAYSYGLEFLAKKESGRFTGWASYTLSETKRTIPDINKGETYYAPYDKTHDISLILSYDMYDWLNVSTNWLYSTAMPITVPTSVLEYGNEHVPLWSDRNSVRVPGTDYHRLDFSATFYFSQKKKLKHSLNVSVYNVYARKNAYSVNFQESEDDPNVMESKKLYLFKVLPSLTYNFSF
ncbi:carboxypeptidase-like regulatory domain-containing protein [Bacteroidota bacterium]